MVKMMGLSDEMVDLVNFCLTGVNNDTKISDIGVSTKGQARRALRAQYLCKLRKNPSRLSILAKELDNAPMAALRIFVLPCACDFVN